MLSEDDSHTELNCHLSIQGLQSHLQASWKVLMSLTPHHMKGNSSHAQGISPLSAAPCSPAQRCYFTLPQDEGGVSAGTQGHWWGVLCTLDIHLTCSREAAWSSEQSRDPPNGTQADALHACVSTGLFQHFQLWFILPWVFIYKPLLCSVQPGVSHTHIPATSWFLWKGRANIWEV